MATIKQLLLTRLQGLRVVPSDVPSRPPSSVPQQRSPEPPVGAFTLEWRRGYRHIPAVYIVRQLQAHSKPRKFWPLYLVLISEWPLVLNGLLFLVYPQWAAVKGRAMLLIAGFSLTVALMLLSAMVAWTFPGERGYFSTILSRTRHSAFKSASGSLATCLIEGSSDPCGWCYIRAHLLVLGPPPGGANCAMAVPSYLLVSWTSFVGGNVAYWLWIAPGVPKRLSRCQNIRLHWQAPLQLQVSV